MNTTSILSQNNQGRYQRVVPAWIRRLLHLAYWRVLPGVLRGEAFLTRLAIRRTCCKVIAGPFKGLSYVSASYGSVFVPKLLGIYEQELHPCIEEIIAGSPSCVIDLGTAEGYYAVGFAVRLPRAKIIGYEMSANARRLAHELAERNSVAERIELRGECTVESLASFVPSLPCLVVCDIDGGEDLILNPAKILWLANATLLVELHDFLLPGIEAKMKERFAATHLVTVIEQTERGPALFPFRSVGTSLIPDIIRARVVCEWRPAPQSWLYAVPKNGML